MLKNIIIPTKSTKEAITGEELTAGSSRTDLRIKGSMEPTIALHDGLLVAVRLLGDVEVPELVDVAVLVARNHAQPVADVVLLQVLLREVLQVALRVREGCVR